GVAAAGRETEAGSSRSVAAEVVDRIVVADDPEAILQRFAGEGWTDGLPIVPPTPERVAQMLAGSDLEPGTSLGAMPPRWREGTIAKIAVNAVMAGCKPEYFPVVVTAVRGRLARAVNPDGGQGTTKPANPVPVLNRP